MPHARTVRLGPLPRSAGHGCVSEILGTRGYTSAASEHSDYRLTHRIPFTKPSVRQRIAFKDPYLVWCTGSEPHYVATLFENRVTVWEKLRYDIRIRIVSMTTDQKLPAPSRFGLQRFADLLPVRAPIIGEDAGNFERFHAGMMQSLLPMTPYEASSLKTSSQSNGNCCSIVACGMQRLAKISHA